MFRNNMIHFEAVPLGPRFNSLGSSPKLEKSALGVTKKGAWRMKMRVVALRMLDHRYSMKRNKYVTLPARSESTHIKKKNVFEKECKIK